MPRAQGRGRWLRPLLLAVLVVLMLRAFVVQPFSVPTGSMEPTIQPGDRLLASRLVRGAAVHRGDVVVFDGRVSFGNESDGSDLERALRTVASVLSLDTGTDYVKRVIGLPGDHVVCCDTRGLLLVNGTSVAEPYLYPGETPSEVTFDVTVPEGRIWVMGDHRSESSDSRAYLGRPGGGMVRLDDVIGQATVRYWPLGRLGSLGGPGPLSTVIPPGDGH